MTLRLFAMGWLFSPYVFIAISLFPMLCSCYSRCLLVFLSLFSIVVNVFILFLVFCRFRANRQQDSLMVYGRQTPWNGIGVQALRTWELYLKEFGIFTKWLISRSRLIPPYPSQDGALNIERIASAQSISVFSQE